MCPISRGSVKAKQGPINADQWQLQLHQPFIGRMQPKLHFLANLLLFTSTFWFPEDCHGHMYLFAFRPKPFPKGKIPGKEQTEGMHDTTSAV